MGPRATLSLEISETFKKIFENLVAEEIRRNLLIMRGEIAKEQKRIIEEYWNFFNQLKEDLQKQRKEIESWSQIISQKFKEGILEIRKAREEIQTKIAEEEKMKIEEFSKSLEKIFIEKQNKLLKEEKEKFKNFAQKIERGTEEILRDFKMNLEKEMEKAKREIELFREEKIREIDRKFYALFNKVTKEILRKSIDLSTHENLVMEALEKAKKEFF